MVGPYAIVRECLRAGEPVALATVVEVTLAGVPGGGGPRLGAKLIARPQTEHVGSLGDPGLDHAVVRDALAALETGRSLSRRYGAHGEAEGTVAGCAGAGGTGAEGATVTVFSEVFVPSRRMIILGAADFAAALVRVAKVLGFRVTVCDARPAFATAARFPEADEIVVDWPHRYLATVADRLGPHDALCVLTHDHKFDVPAIVAALGSRVGYIGAMGSRRTHAGRVDRLRQQGVDEAGLERVMAPIGIDVGARTPEEAAVSICAEIIAVHAGTPTCSLRGGSGPIHRAPVA